MSLSTPSTASYEPAEFQWSSMRIRTVMFLIIVSTSFNIVQLIQDQKTNALATNLYDASLGLNSLAILTSLVLLVRVDLFKNIFVFYGWLLTVLAPTVMWFIAKQKASPRSPSNN